MTDASSMDAEAKKRAKRERLEAWRREQAAKKRQTPDDSTGSDKGTRQDAVASGADSSAAKRRTLGLRGTGSVSYTHLTLPTTYSV